MSNNGLLAGLQLCATWAFTVCLLSNPLSCSWWASKPAALGTQEAGTKEERRLTHLAALLLPLRRCSVPDKKGRQPLAAHIVAHEVKWKAKDAEHVARLHQQTPELLRIARALQVITLP